MATPVLGWNSCLIAANIEYITLRVVMDKIHKLAGIALLVAKRFYSIFK